MNNISFNKFNNLIDDFINNKINLDIEKDLLNKNINLLMDTKYLIKILCLRKLPECIL